jgi:hypothetical protein
MRTGLAVTIAGASVALLSKAAWDIWTDHKRHKARRVKRASKTVGSLVSSLHTDTL